MNSNNQILIVGAGPTGLIMAHELLRRRVPVRLIEKRQGPSHTTRAMTVHARSMEMFEHIGLAHRLEDVCLECPGNIYHFPEMPDEELPRTDYRVLPTRFPFYYKINQNDFEQVLREHLYSQYSVKPEYRTELTSLEQKGDQVHAVISHEDGSEEKASFAWAVGCDGVKSFVRQAAGIAFNGDKVADMAMMDVELSNVTFDDRWMNYYFNKDLFMNCTKLPGKFWRIYMSEPTGEYVHAKDKRQAFQDVADQLGIGFKVGEPHWVTAWDIRNNIAEKYRNGRMLICGDASHVHSPSGGQGMNGCMQDAYNLGWKLAAVFNGDADHEILDTYEVERKPIGEQITEGAMATHDIVMGFGTEPKDRVHLTQEPGWEERTINLVSGLSHNYSDVVKVPANLTPTNGPKAGARAPDALLVREPNRRLYDLLRHPGFTLLIVPGTNTEEALKCGKAIREALDKDFPNKVACCLIAEGRDTNFDKDHPNLVGSCHIDDVVGSDFDMDHLAADETGEIVERYAVGEQGSFILIRPDLYIGMTCLPSEWASISEYMSQWFVSASSDNQQVPAKKSLEAVG